MKSINWQNENAKRKVVIYMKLCSMWGGWMCEEAALNYHPMICSS